MKAKTLVPYCVSLFWLMPFLQVSALNVNQHQHYDRLYAISLSYLESYGFDRVFSSLKLQDGIPENDHAIAAYYPDGRIGINWDRFNKVPYGTQLCVLVHEILHSLDPRSFDPIWTERFTQYVAERIIFSQGFPIDRNPYSTTYLHIVLDSMDIHDLVDLYVTGSWEEFLVYTRW